MRAKLVPSGELTSDRTMKGALIFFQEQFPHCESPCNYRTLIQIFRLLLEVRRNGNVTHVASSHFYCRTTLCTCFSLTVEHSPGPTQALALSPSPTFYPPVSPFLMRTHSCNQCRAFLHSETMHQREQRADLSPFQKEPLIQPS